MKAAVHIINQISLDRNDEEFLKTTMAKFVDSKSAPEFHYEEVDVSLIKPRKRDYSKSKS